MLRSYRGLCMIWARIGLTMLRSSTRKDSYRGLVRFDEYDEHSDVTLLSRGTILSKYSKVR